MTVAAVRLETGVAFLTGMELSGALTQEQRSALAESGLDPVSKGGPVAGPYFRADAIDHGTRVLPTGFAAPTERQIATLLASIPAIDGWEVASADVAVHDYGVATIVLTWLLHNSNITGIDDLKSVLPLINDATFTALQPLAADVVSRLDSALGNSESAAGIAGLLDGVRDTVPRPGQLLWIWDHLVVEAPVGGDHTVVAVKVADALCPNDHGLLVHRDHTFAPGVGVSITCSAADLGHDGVALSRVLPQQDAWWTLMWALDRALLQLQDESHCGLRYASLEELAFRARQIASVTGRVRHLRTRVDSLLVSAGARELAAWHSLAEPWFLDVRANSVERKLDALAQSYRDVVEESKRRKADQIALMVYIFTAVSVVASVISVTQYAQGDQAGGLGVRLLILIVSIFAALGAVASTLRAQRLRHPARG